MKYEEPKKVWVVKHDPRTHTVERHPRELMEETEKDYVFVPTELRWLNNVERRDDRQVAVCIDELTSKEAMAAMHVAEAAATQEESEKLALQASLHRKAARDLLEEVAFTRAGLSGFERTAK